MDVESPVEQNGYSMARTDVKRAFGQRLRALRLARQWSQEHLASVVGLDRSYVGSVERGERNVSLQNIVKFAEALEVPPASLMEFSHG